MIFYYKMFDMAIEGIFAIHNQSLWISKKKSENILYFTYKQLVQSNEIIF